MEYLTREELLRVLAEARKHRERDWVWILVAFWHGLRISEVLALSAADFATGELVVQRRKKSKRTGQPLMGSDEPLLDERAAVSSWIERHPEGLLFPIKRWQGWHLMQLYCRRAGISKDKAHPHALKHSIAMTLIAELPIHLVQQRLGHKSLRSTMCYIHGSDAEANAAVERLSKRFGKREGEADKTLNSLGGIGVAEALRRVLRELEKGEQAPRRRKRSSR